MTLVFYALACLFTIRGCYLNRFWDLSMAMVCALLALLSVIP